MISFVEYVFGEVKNQRLQKGDAVDLLRQFQERKQASSSLQHPLLHTNTSDLGSMRFSSTFSGNETFLADHVVRGEKVMPAVALLEMARAAFEKATSGQDGEFSAAHVKLINLVFIRPLIVQGPTTVHVQLYQQESGQVDFDIYVDGENDVESVACRGHAMLSDIAEPPRLDSNALRPRVTQKLSAEECYQLFDHLGMSYGPSHRGIAGLSIGLDAEQRRFVIADLALPPQAEQSAAEYVLHPGVMDAAFQAVIGWTEEDNANNGAGREASLPFAIEAVEIFDRSPRNGLAYLRASSSAQGDFQKFDVSICDESDRVCIQLRGLSLRTSRATDEPKAELVFLAPAWSSFTATGNVAEAAYGSHRVVLCGSPGAPGYMSAVQAELPDVQFVSCPYQLTGDIGYDATDVTVNMFRIMQSLLLEQPNGDVLFQVVLQDLQDAVCFSGLLGLLRTASHENPRLKFQLILTEASEEPSSLAARLKENSYAPLQDYVRYRNGERQVQLWSEIASQKESRPWRDGGVYLIAGGGELGFQFAREIATSTSGSTLVVAARSPLSADRQQQLNEIAGHCSAIEYKCVDVTDGPAVDALIAEIVRDFHGLHGVIHTAGSLHDKFLINKTELEVKTVLAPKIQGAVHLDRATRHLHLDLFVLFSSVAGVLGNVGQADYAAGNAFLDGFADHRMELVNNGERYGKTLSLNWPLWASGGMRVHDEIAEMMQRRMETVSLTTEMGIEAFYRAMAMKDSQILILCGDKDKITKSLTRRAAVQTASTAKPPTTSPLAEQSDLNAVTVRLTHYLKSILASTLRMERNSIVADEPLENYGIDSIRVLELTAELEKDFGSLPKTLFFEYLTVDALVGYLLDQNRQRALQLFGAEAKPVSTVKIDEPRHSPAPPARPVLRARRGTAGMESRVDNIAERIATQRSDIAIIGMSGRYPKAKNLSAYWENLKNGVDCVTPIPEERWDSSIYFDPEKGKLGKSYCSSGGFIDGVDCFDALFFHIAPREAERMDPQERLFLQCVYETLEDAGYTRETVKQGGEEGKGADVGVFVGVMYEEYQLFAAQAQALGQPFALSGNPSLIANRVSHFFNLRGPSIALDTMCSSSLTAIHLACQSLRRGECTFAVAGGVNVTIHPNKYLALSQGHFASSQGRCESFGEGGDGYVPGEGIGAVLLKPLSAALRDRDQIYGVIKGTAINHGGRASGFSVPSPVAQAEVIARAIRESGVQARAISYIEAHGTGTKLGDPIEIAGLTKAFSEFTEDKQFCAIGSAKSNVGHCESAAGIAGLTKILLQMKHGYLVPSLHAGKLNPYIDFAQTPFAVQTALAAWRRPTLEIDGQYREWPLTAGLSSFGAGGSNAHILVEEYIAAEEPSAFPATPSAASAIILSARSDEQLHQRAKDLLDHLDAASSSAVDLEALAYTLQIGREAMDNRLAFVAADIDGVKEKLRLYLDGKTGADELFVGEVKRSRESLGVLNLDEEMQETIGKWIERRKYPRLLDLWVRGLSFDWSGLYGSTKPRRISLPTYPFANERCWIPDLSQLRLSAVGSVPSHLHPLIHANTSKLGEQRFSSHFTGDEFFFEDHLVQGVRMLPGAAYLEMAMAAVRLATDRLAPVELTNVVWSHPFVATGTPAALHLGLFEDRFSQLTFEVYSQDNESSEDVNAADEVIYARGAFRFEEQEQPISLDLNALWSRCDDQPTNAEQVYELHQALGIAYGPAHRGVVRLGRGTDQDGGSFVIGEINLPAVISNTYSDFELHPSLIDSALHASIGWMDIGDESDGPAQTWVPFALEEMRVFGRCPARLFAVIRQESETAGNFKKSNYDLCDADGKVCVQLRGFIARPIETDAPLTTESSFSESTDQALVAASMTRRVAAVEDVTGLLQAVNDSGTTLQESAVTFLKNLLSSTLKVPARLIDAGSPLEEYGIDSILVIQLTQELEGSLGPLSKTLFFEYQTLDALAKYLMESHRDKLRQLVASEVPTTEKAVLPRSQPLSSGASGAGVSSHRSRRHSSFAMVQPPKPQSGWEDVAIIGIAGRYPQARDLAEYWENLKAGKDCITEIPSDRWDVNMYFDPEKGKMGKTYSKWGGFIEGVDQFDPLFFNISPREAEGMDPQERLFLQCAYHTIQDAGYTRESLARYRALGLDGNVGVFVGVMYEEYQLLGAQAQAIGFPFALPGNPSSIANRVSYYLNLHGPSMALDTMCSSSLTAIHLACESLQRRGCELAIAGGVNVSIHPNKYLSLAQGRFFSSVGRCESFGEGGDGFVPGEGVGAILLKPLSAAIADHDRIQGVIKATSINHGGKTNGYSVPNPIAQASVIANALDRSGIPSRAVSYIEAHGTGTTLGDPIEITGLCKAFGQSDGETQFCTIGSAKSNIGHCESAAGIAGVTKVLLQMKHRQFVPSLHAETLNPHIDFASSPFVVRRQEAEWIRPVIAVDGKAKEYPRIAGVSSFGAGGSNAHILIEEYVDPRAGRDNKPSLHTPSVIVVSARTEAQLLLQVVDLARFVERHDLDNGDLADIAYTLQTGREAMDHRVAIVATTLQMLLDKLRLLATGESSIEDVFSGVLKRGVDQVELFHADEDLRGVVEAWVEKGRLGRLAEMWAKGMTFDWNRIHGPVKPRRIALPLYPFARDRYWVLKPEVSLTSSVGVATGGNAALHPLLHQNTSDFLEQRFTSAFTGHEFVLRDHRIGGRKVLPGVVYLEMVRAACEYSSAQSQEALASAVVIRNVAWNHPLEVEAETATVHIALHPRESGEIRFEVFSDKRLLEHQVFSDPVTHAQGVVILQEKEDPQFIDLVHLRKYLENPVDPKQFYESHRVMGIEYGPAFQVVYSIAAGVDSDGSRFVLADLRLPQSLTGTRSSYELHPSILDGALHSSLALFAEVNSIETKGDSSAPWLPFALDELAIHAPSPEETWVLIRESSLSSGSVRKLDIELCDERGKLWARMKGFAARKRELHVEKQQLKTTPASAAAAALATMTFSEEWTKAPLQSPQKTGPRTVICFLTANENRYAAAEAISRLDPGARIIFIGAGESYFKASPHDYRVAQDEPSSMTEALREIEREHGSVDALLYLWPLETTDLSGAYGAIQVVIQALAASKLRPPRALLAASYENELDLCYVDSWVGFERSLRLVTLSTKWSVIACERSSDGQTDLPIGMNQWISRLWSELRNATAESALYVGGTRHALTLQPTELQTGTCHLRHHGTYLITGGGGGLGLVVAEYLARVYAANLVLTGRSELNQARSEKLLQLEQWGGGVIYQPADVSDAAQMAAAIDHGRKRFGSIDGAIHCAGVQHNESILDSGAESFNQVLTPKVSGSLVLDELFKDEPLDFIAYFSSSSAILGDFGACSYAVANRFQNAFARYQNQQAQLGHRSGKVIAIDWPLWKDGGMSVGEDQMTEVYLKSTGQRALESEEAMQLFEQLLADPRAVQLVMAGDPARVGRLVGCEPVTSVQETPRLADKANVIPAPNMAAAKPVHLPTASQNSTLESKVIEYLKDLLSSHLKLAPILIEPETPFDEFGVDSVIVMELTDALEKDLGSLPKTLFFEYSSVRSLAIHLARKYSVPVSALFGMPAETDARQKPQAPQSVPVPADRTIKHTYRTSFTNVTEVQQAVVGRPSRDIAIVGVSGRYPQAENMDEFWANLKQGRDCVTEIPTDRWDHSQYFDSDRGAQRKSYSKWGGFITDVDVFDPLFFNINPLEARFMDPQERIFLETVWNVLEGAGYTRHSLREKYAGKVGVYVGSMYQEYGSVAPRSAIANRVSYFFGLEGPSMVIDTMCSSSATAIHNACVDLLNGDCQLAIAGGVNLSTHPSKYVSLSQAQLLGSHGGSRSFGQGDGYIPCEGVGAVLLKPLARAIEDGDDILAVIKATSVSHGGRSNGYSVPNLNAQADLIRDTLKKAEIDPATISYVEAAATGSSLGDPIELGALEKAFALESINTTCAIGSVKSNLGHPEAASGMAQLSKVVLQMRHAQLVPSILAAPLNPNLKLEGSPFHLQRELTEWKRLTEMKSSSQQEHPRRTVLNSFGAGGSNACMVLEEFISNRKRDHITETPSTIGDALELVVLSAKNEGRLAAVIDRMLAYLKSEPNVNLADLAYTLQIGREAMNYRAAMVVKSCDQLIAALEAYRSGSTGVSLTVVNDVSSRSPITALIEGKPGETMLDMMVAGGQLEKLALMWAHGARVPWSLLPRAGRPQLIALPTYPFERSRMSAGSASLANDEQNLTPSIADADGPPMMDSVSEDPTSWFQKTANIAPRTELEIAIAEVWEEALSIKGIGVDDGFLELGGNSIQGGQIMAKLEDLFNIKLPFDVLLGSQPTIAGVAVAIVSELLKEDITVTADMDDRVAEALQG